MTFSTIVMSSKVAGTWKVRPMPSRACVSGLARVTSCPAKRTVPLVGGRSPARQLKKVDLPAPFGPMRPTMSPSSIARSALESATKAPKLRLTPRASSSTGLRPQEGEARREAVPDLGDPARLEARDEDDDAAVEDVGQPGAAAAEIGVRRGLQRDEDGGADQGAEERAGAAERRGDDELDRAQDAEAALRVDEADHEGVERPGDAGEGGAEHESVELVEPDIDAEAARRPLARLDGAQVEPHPAPPDVPGEEEEERQHRE